MEIYPVGHHKKGLNVRIKTFLPHPGLHHTYYALTSLSNKSQLDKQLRRNWQRGSNNGATHIMEKHLYMAMACHFLDAEQALDNTIKALQWTALTLPLHPTSHNNNSLWNPQPPDVDAPTEWYNQWLIPREDAQDSFFETPYLPTMSTPDADTIITLSTLNPQAQNSFITPNNHHSIHVHLNTSSTMTNTGKNPAYHTVNHMRMSTIKHPVE